MKTIKNAIVAFHIGRGGQFNNAGHLSYIGEKKIGDFTDDLFLRYKNERNFSKRYGYDFRHDGPTILDCLNDEDWDTLETDFGITAEQLGPLTYYGGNGEEVGLTHEDVKTGIGFIEIDGQYNTTYTCYLKDCGERGFRLIYELESNTELKQYAEERLKELGAL